MNVVIMSVAAGNNSKNGNPSKVITVEGGEVFRTAPDSQVGYYIENSEYLGVPVHLSLDTKGRVTCATIIGE